MRYSGPYFLRTFRDLAFAIESVDGLGLSHLPLRTWPFALLEALTLSGWAG
jgi:hypothetical protein